MRIRVVGAIVAITLAVPSMAGAQWRWLDKLSGPGPFVTYLGEFKLLCAYEPKDAQNDTVKSRRSEANDALVLTLSVPCLRHSGDPDPLKRKWALGVSGGFGVSLANSLQYEPPASTAQRRVFILPVEFFGDVNPCLAWFKATWCRRFDVGAFGGAHFFMGGETIPTTGKLAGGLRASYNLLAFGEGKSDGLRGSVKLRGGYLWYLKGFTAEDFGAVGTYSAGAGERIGFAAFVVDIDAWR